MESLNQYANFQRFEELDNNFTSMSQNENNESPNNQICESNPNTPGARKRAQSQVITNEELKIQQHQVQTEQDYDSNCSSADHQSDTFRNDHFKTFSGSQQTTFNNTGQRKQGNQTGQQTNNRDYEKKLKPFSFLIKEDPSKQSEEIVDKSKYKIDNPIMNEQSLRSLFIQEFKQGDANNPVVYNRYSAQFGIQTSAFQNSAYQILKSEFNPMTQLVNVKELISADIKSNSNSTQPIVLPYYTPQDGNDKTLVFESRFESGNLAMAFKLSENEYNLVLSNDINTKGHTQWFFFRVTNVHKDISVKFNVLNHTKPDSLFNQGMKPLIYSETINKNSGIGWHRDGRDIAYFQNNFKKFDEDTVYFAYAYPYTYSDLTEELTNIERDSVKGQYISRNVLCRTIAGNKCEYLTITAKNHPDQKQERKGVFLSARIHPGESNSSWMMKGIIDFLVSEAPEAKILREKFIFKIIPMLNPDGVINGNYRCSLAGGDLNRRWKVPTKLLYPEVFETKRLCKQFQRERQIVLYCDLHGHSRDKNIFIYGNNYSENPESTRLFPFIMSKVLDCFSYDSCRFNMHKSKETTARIAMWKELKIPTVYTMEASFCGSEIGKNAGLHFTTEHLMEAGKKLCIALLIYCDIDVPKALKDINNQKKKKKGKNVPQLVDQAQQVEQEQIDFEISEELKIYTRKSLIAELMGDKKLLNAGSKNESGDGGGSDSDPSEDNMEEEDMAKIIPIKVAQKKKQDPKKEEIKEQKQQQTSAKKSPIKKFNQGGSFFDRVRLPKSYGMRRVEMVDAWTQTSNRGSDTDQQKEDPNKDESIQAQIAIINKEIAESNNDSFILNSSYANANKSRVLVPISQKRQSLSPIKNDFSAIKDRMQAMQVINQYIKESQMTVKDTANQQFTNDPYNFFMQQQQTSPDKTIMSTHIFHTEKKASLNKELIQKKQNQAEKSQISGHKRQGSGLSQNYYLDSAQTQNNSAMPQMNLNRGLSEANAHLQNQKTMDSKDFLASPLINTQALQSSFLNPQQSNRLPSTTAKQNTIQTSPDQTQSQLNQNLRSLSGNTYLKTKQSDQCQQPSQLSHIRQNPNDTTQSHTNQKHRNSFNAKHLMQKNQGNSRVTALPQLNNESVRKQQAIKQNKSHSFYEGIKPQNSFKINNLGTGQNLRSDYKNSNDDQFFNSSFIQGNISPVPFENVHHKNFKIIPNRIIQSNSNQLHNNTDPNKLQPAEDFTPQSSHTRDQLSGQIYSQKWQPKSRRGICNTNLNSGLANVSVNNINHQALGVVGNNTIEEFKKKKEATSVKKRKSSEQIGGSASKSFVQNSTSSNIFSGSLNKKPKGAAFRKQKN